MNKSKNTAIGRNRPSRPLKKLVNDGMISGKVLDFGCGKGKDVEYLNSIDGVVCSGYDKYHTQNAHILKFGVFDTCLCTYVLNVIDNEEERKEAIQDMYDSVKVGGIIIITTRTVSEIRSISKTNGWHVYNDGYLTKTNTFQKGFNNVDLYTLVMNVLGLKGCGVEMRSTNHYTQIIIQKK